MYFNQIFYPMPIVWDQVASKENRTTWKGDWTLGIISWIFEIRKYYIEKWIARIKIRASKFKKGKGLIL